MSKWMLAAGAAALAIVSPALAQKGHEGGGKGGGNKGHAAQDVKADRGGGGGGKNRQAKASGGGGDRTAHVQKQHGGGGDRAHGAKVAQNDRGQGRGNDQVRVKSHGNEHVKVDNRGDRGRVARIEGDQGHGRGQNWDDQGKIHGRDLDHVRVVNANDRIRVLDRDFDDVDARFAPRWSDRGMRLGFADGCPPGLAKKGNGCLPPGQARKLVGTVLAPGLMSNSLVGPYRLWYPDNDRYIYRWDDDYIYRVRRDGDLIDAMFPYANRDYYYYPVGAAYPDNYNYYNVPYQYQSFYPDGGDYLYRYGDGAIYMVDPGTQMIQGIAALLTGAPLTVGQPLPPAYGVYNVPLSYRSTYYDSPDAMYRYNDGYIYRVDPTTMLITSVINALV